MPLVMVRILLCGDVKGQLWKLSEHIAKMHAKLEESQHFQAVFCVGEFSSEEMDLETKPPIPVHFIDAGPATADLVEASPQGEEVAPNLHFLGHYGVVTVAGLKVAFLSGRRHPDLFTEEAAAEPDDDGEAGGAAAAGAGAPPEDLKQRYGAQESDDVLRPSSMASGSSSGPRAPSWEDMKAKEERAAKLKAQLFIGDKYTPLAIERLKEEIADAGGVDLLLTAEWPGGCMKGVPRAWPEEADHRKLVKAAYRHCAAQPAGDLAAAAEPKYHAVGLGGVFWRRQPWHHERRGEVVQSTGELRCGACRMVALGSIDGAGPPMPAPKGAAAAAAVKAEPPKLPPQKWLHGLDLDPNALPAPADDATVSPWSEKVVESAGVDGSTGPDGAPLRLDVKLDDPEERRRWIQRFGCLPVQMQQLSDKLAKMDKPKEKKEHHKSLYKVSEKEKKRRKTGGDGHLPGHAKERMQANRG